MKSLFAAALAIALIAADLPRGQAPAVRTPNRRVPELEFDSVPDFFKLPEGMNFGEVSGVAINSKGPRLRLHALEQRGRAGLRADGRAVARVRPARTIRPRDRQGPVRLVVRAHGPRRSRRQHLGGRQGLGHGRQVQPGRPRDDGVRAAPRIGRRRDRTVGTARPAARARRRPVPPADRRRVGLARATPTSATATSTRASPSTIATATG